MLSFSGRGGGGPNGNIYVTQTIVAHGVKSGRNVIIMTLKNRY